MVALGIVFLTMVVLLPIRGDAQVLVPGYLRHDGTYVQPHWRSTPDGSPFNTYGFRRPQGIDPSIPLAGRTPPLSLSPFFDAVRQRQESELRQLEIAERRRRLLAR